MRLAWPREEGVAILDDSINLYVCMYMYLIFFSPHFSGVAVVAWIRSFISHEVDKESAVQQRGRLVVIGTLYSRERNQRGGPIGLVECRICGRRGQSLLVILIKVLNNPRVWKTTHVHKIIMNENRWDGGQTPTGRVSVREWAIPLPASIDWTPTYVQWW